MIKSELDIAYAAANARKGAKSFELMINKYIRKYMKLPYCEVNTIGTMSQNLN